MSSKEEDDVQSALTTLENAIRVQVEKGLVKTDIMVSTQRSRFYKAWCYAIYGHLPGSNGTCLRCGKKLNNIVVPKVQIIKKDQQL